MWLLECYLEYLLGILEYLHTEHRYVQYVTGALQVHWMMMMMKLSNADAPTFILVTHTMVYAVYMQLPQGQGKWVLRECAVTRLCPAHFSTTGHTAPPGPQHWPSRLNRPLQARSSVDQWSRVPTGRRIGRTDVLSVYSVSEKLDSHHHAVASKLSAQEQWTAERTQLVTQLAEVQLLFVQEKAQLVNLLSSSSHEYY